MGFEPATELAQGAGLALGGELQGGMESVLAKGFLLDKVSSLDEGWAWMAEWVKLGPLVGMEGWAWAEVWARDTGWDRGVGWG